MKNGFQLKRVLNFLYRELRIFKYKRLSTCKNIIGKPIYNTPALINGLGSFIFGKNVDLGIYSSPYFYSTYIYLETRTADSIISIGQNVSINNNACMISEGEGIFIEDNVLIGPSFTAFDSDFHGLEPSERLAGNHLTKKIIISKNVFIGANVTILKGVTIGENSIIANGAVVSNSIASNVIAGGNPCKIIRNLI